MPTNSQYDFIITGAGCAGLSLAVHFIRAGILDNRRLLIVDKEQKKINDRTWCFWDSHAGPFEDVVSHRWDKAWFYSNYSSRLMDLQPFQYKMIRGEQFYRYCFDIIRQHPNVQFEIDDVLAIDATKGEVKTATASYFASRIFNSILFSTPRLSAKDIYLKQHFRGWVIECANNVFDTSCIRLMDFRVPQQGGNDFVYVLPFSSTSALVEYTAFSKSVYSSELYDNGLRYYLENILGTANYKVREEESGLIPMTNYKFIQRHGKITNIGTAGGMTRGSSGYTFYFIQKQCAQISNAILMNLGSGRSVSPRRAAYFDSVLLNVLATKKMSSEKIFTRLFTRNIPQDILTFLNGESTILTDLKIISSLPTLPFLKAGVKMMF